MDFLSLLYRMLRSVLSKARNFTTDVVFSEHHYEEPKIVPVYVTLKPVTFHEEKGRNVRLGINRRIAYRSCDFGDGYVFMPESFKGKESFVVVQILEIDRACLGSLAFGVTSKDPTSTRPSTFPSNPGKLDDGCSYLVSSNVAKSSKEGDVLIFYLNEKNEMNVIINEKLEKTLFSVSENTSYWWFFDVYGSTRKIRAYLADKHEIDLIQCRAYEVNSTTVSEGEPLLKLKSYVTKEKVRFKPVGTSLLPEEDSSTGCCIECLLNPCNSCMLYPCGHLILCYGCALKLQDERGRCPKCFSMIDNAIRLFRQ